MYGHDAEKPRPSLYTKYYHTEHIFLSHTYIISYCLTNAAVQLNVSVNVNN